MQAIELSHTTPYIDFHYNNSQSDYTARIIANGDQDLQIQANNVITMTSPAVSFTGRIVANEIFCNAAITEQGYRVVTCRDDNNRIQFEWKATGEGASGGLYVIIDGSSTFGPIITS